MKKILLSLIALLACVALFTSCEDDFSKRQAVFNATMPADDLSSLRPGSIINGVPAADGFNLNARWRDGDKIQIFVRQDGRVYQVENPAVVSGIGSDGKTCSFELVLPKSVKPDRDYDIIGVTGVEAYIDGEDVIASCELKRVGIDSDDAPLLPMWFTAKKGSNQVKFRHLCTYEILYVNNNSNSSIKFKHAGFNVITPWYKHSDKVVLTNSSRYETVNDSQTDAESNEITIAAGETGTIVSWYIPKFVVTDETTEATINNAKLKAVVNGAAVTTIDPIISHKNIARGNAYYMQVTWDGSHLFYPNDLCPDSNHPHMIDLGLPSGTKWACCNVGANSPVECGGYFAWGETTTKTSFKEYNYKWYNENRNRITKYCGNSDYGTVDDRTELEPEDDAAYVNWGPEWRMPYLGHLYELMRNCTNEWTTVNGMGGFPFKSKINGNAIFIPAAGWIYNGVQGLETDGTYWCRDYYYDKRPDLAFALGFRKMANLTPSYYARHNGASVRPVHYVPQE